MKGRFDQGLIAMRKGLRSFTDEPPANNNAQLRKQQALAEHIASSMADYEYSPAHWQTYFDFALREIQQFDREFEEVRA